MILEFRPHYGKMRIPVRGQKVHASVSVRYRPPGMAVDREVNETPETPESAREHCGYCDQRWERSYSLSFVIVLTETLDDLNNLKRLIERALWVKMAWIRRRVVTVLCFESILGVSVHAALLYNSLYFGLKLVHVLKPPRRLSNPRTTTSSQHLSIPLPSFIPTAIISFRISYAHHPLDPWRMNIFRSFTCWYSIYLLPCVP